MASGLARGPLLVGVLVVAAGALLFFRPFLTADREVVASTPSPPAVFTATVLALEPGSEACLEGVTYEPDAEIGRFHVQQGAAPPLRVRGRAPGYRFERAIAAGYVPGPIEFRLPRAARPVLGTLCIENAGRQPVPLVATGEGRTLSRPVVRVDGVAIQMDVPLTLRRAALGSLAERVPEVVAHAEALSPGARWVHWLLLVLVAVGLPAAVLWAVARAAVLPPAPAPAPVRPAPRPPLPGLLPRASRGARAAAAALARVPTPVLLGLLIALAGGFVFMWAARIGTWQNDEQEYVYLARLIPNMLPEALWDTDVFWRGIQRLEPFMLSVPLGLLPGPDALLAGRAVNVAAWVSTAVPVFLLARGVGAQRPWALLAAGLSITGPWIVIATSFLTEPLAYPLSAWVLWAVWRAALRPTAGAQLLALGLVALAALSRTAWLVFLALPPLAVVLVELRAHDRRGPRAAGPRAAVGDLAGRLWRRHRVITVAVAAGVLAAALGAVGALPGAASLTGWYSAPFETPPWGYAQKIADRLPPLIAGAGFLPFALGVPWLVREAWRPAGRESYAYAVTALAMLALFFYASQPAGFDERYGIYVGPPLFVALAAALSRRDLAPVAVAAAGAAAAVLLSRHDWTLAAAGYDYFARPAEAFLGVLFLNRLSGYLPSWLPLATAILVLALALAAACAYAAGRRRGSQAALAALVAGLVLAQLAQTEFPVRRFAQEAGGRFGPSLGERGFVDRQIYGEGRAAVFADAQGNSTAFESVWTDVDFWNTSLDAFALVGPRNVRVPPGDRLVAVTPDPEDGRLASDAPLPPYLVVSRSFRTVGVAGEVVAEAPHLPVALVRRTDPPRARWLATGASPDGFMESGGRVELRFFTAGLAPGRRWCATVPVVAALDATGAAPGRSYRLAVGTGRVAGRLRNSESATLTLPLSTAAGGRVDGELVARGSAQYADGRRVSLQLGAIAVLPCPPPR